MPSESYGNTVSALDELAQKAGSDKEEAQIIRLKNAARKTSAELAIVHRQMREALDADEDNPKVHHELAERASTLRNKLYYLNDIGKEVSKGAFEEFKAPPIPPGQSIRGEEPAGKPGMLKKEIHKDLYGF